MKVALLSLYNYDEVKGGTEVFVEYLKKVFSDMTLITYSDCQKKLNLKMDKFNLEEPRMGLAISKRFNELNRSEHFDLVIANGSVGWYLSVSGCKVPMINVYHYTLKGFANQVLKGTPGYVPSRYFCPMFEKITSLGKMCIGVSHKINRELKGLYNIDSTVIENGIPLDRFAPRSREDAREELGIRCDQPLGLFVGRADETKGFDIVRSLSKSRHDLRFMCVTPSHIDEPGMLVFHNVSHERMPTYYAAADFLIFPSRYESVGYTALESMACDVPAITSNTGIFEDMDGSEAGKVVDGYLPESYSNAIDDILYGPKLHPRIIISERFSMDRFRTNYQNAAIRAMATRLDKNDIKENVKAF